MGKEEIRKIMVSWAQSIRTFATDEMRSTYEEYHKSQWNDEGKSTEVIKYGRMHTANDIVMWCINDLNNSQLEKLDAALMEFARDVPEEQRRGRRI